jgi:hypothetical protein
MLQADDALGIALSFTLFLKALNYFQESRSSERMGVTIPRTWMNVAFVSAKIGVLNVPDNQPYGRDVSELV